MTCVVQKPSQYGPFVLVTQVVLLPQRNGHELCGDVPADVLHIIRTSDPLGLRREPSPGDLYGVNSRPNLYTLNSGNTTLNSENTTLPACGGAPARAALLGARSCQSRAHASRLTGLCLHQPHGAGAPDI